MPRLKRLSQQRLWRDVAHETQVRVYELHDGDIHSDRAIFVFEPPELSIIVKNGRSRIRGRLVQSCWDNT